MDDESMSSTKTTVLKVGAEYKDKFPIHYLFRNGYVSADTLEAEAEITDHYVEDNTAVQDHMTLKPQQYTLRGFVGEKLFSPYDPYEYTVPERKVNKALAVARLAPVVSSYMQTAMAAYSYVEGSVKRYVGMAKNIADVFNKNKTGKTINATASQDVIPDSKQALAYQEMLNLRDMRVLLTIESPYGIFDDYLVQSARLDQTDTKYQSELVVVLKEFKGTETNLVKVDYKAYSDRFAQQMAAEENVGKIQGKSESTLRSIMPESLVPKFTGQ